jgi:hypothetical protein
MRWKDIMEAPIADLGTFGDLDTEGSFRTSDLNALRNPKWAKKVRSMFERVPFDINVYFYNVPKGKMAPLRPLFSPRLGAPSVEIEQIDVRDVEAFSAQAGSVDPQKIKPIIGELPKDYRSAINCVLMNNEGGGRIALTPWMVGHRIIHALLFDTQRNGSQSKEHNQLFSTYSRLIKDAESWFKITQGMHQDFWGEYEKPRYFQRDNDRVTAVAKVLGTTRAAREGIHINEGEWLVDIMTQWLVRGAVRFNRPDFCETGATEPHPEPEDSPLFLKAREFYRSNQDSWGGVERADNPEEFSKWLIKTHVEEPDPNSSPYRFGYGRAIDPQTGNVVGDFIHRPEAISRYEERGLKVEQYATGEELFRNEMKRYRAYLTRKAKFEAQYRKWLEQEVLGLPGSRGSRTDKCHFHLTKYEDEFNQQISNYMQVAIGKFYVL